ncbi:MAG: hypothetical protein A2W19_03435 [Spirochaetes bacterium RBG_16_49_21]|nr:MAG: hypothetical protein A2W19_03435 [Spirochaetes bacterium RBG_16_49_21]
MDYREASRYAISDVALHKYDIDEVSCGFDFDQSLRGRVVDISLKGLGIEIDNLNSIQTQKVKNLDKYLLTIKFGDDTILAGVKSIWSQVLHGNGNMLFKGGVLIDLISTEDRLTLWGIIEKIRNSL